jgi:hypothetical protein
MNVKLGEDEDTSDDSAVAEMNKPEELPKVKYSVYDSEESPARRNYSKKFTEIKNSEEYSKENESENSPEADCSEEQAEKVEDSGESTEANGLEKQVDKVYDSKETSGTN